MNCYFCFFIWTFLLTLTKSFVGIQSIANFNGSTSSTTINIYAVKIISSGQLVYISMRDSDSLMKIKCYNISTGSFVLSKTFTNTNLVIADGVFLYSAGYVIGLQTTNLNFSIFYANSTYIGRYTVNDTVQQFIQSVSRGIVIYYSTTGKVYWVLANDFPAGNYKTLITSGLTGIVKAFISPDTNYLAVGTSTSSQLIIIQLFHKTILHTFSFNESDTRAICWKSDSSTVYLAPPHSGNVYQLSIVSPFSVVTFSYQVSNTVTAYQTEYVASIGEVVIFTYKSTVQQIKLYSYTTSNASLYHVQTYNSTLVSPYVSFDLSNSLYYAEWSSNQVRVKKLLTSCSTGYYYDQCLLACNLCSASCQNCTAIGCGTCPTTATTTNTTTMHSTTNTTASNTTATNTTASNTTASNTTTTNTTTTNTTTTNTTTSNTTTSNNTSNTTNNITNNFNNSSNTVNYTSKGTNLQSGIYKNFGILLDNTLNSGALQSLNQVPGGRRFLKPIFTFFGNFDDLWLYNYHPRQYQFIISSTLQSIQDLQNQKWSLISYDTLWSFVGVNTSKLRTFFNTKDLYSESKFVQIQGNPNGFFLNTLNFFLSNTLVTVLLFVICRFLFFLLFKYKISIVFRQFSFWPYLILILMDGNLQIAAYLVAFQLKWLFCQSLIQKLLTIWLLTTFFFIFLFSIGAYFLFRFMYGELARYFFDNSKNSNIGAFYMMAQVGLRNIVLGFLHLMISDSYSTKIVTIFLVELSFFCFGVVIVNKNTIFQYKIKAWVNLFATFLRLFVIGTFYFEQNANDGDITDTSPIFVHLIGLYILLGVFSVFYEITKLVLQFFQFTKGNQLIKGLMQQQAHEVILKNKKKLRIVLIDESKTKKAIKVQVVKNRQNVFKPIVQFQANQFVRESKAKKSNYKTVFRLNKGINIKNISLAVDQDKDVQNQQGVFNTPIKQLPNKFIKATRNKNVLTTRFHRRLKSSDPNE